MFNRVWNRFRLYAGLPEMRPFWFFLPFLLIILIVDVFYLPRSWTVVSVVIFIILGVIILVNNLRLARSNLEIKIERNQLRSIISNLSDGVIAYDSNFKILIFNKAAEQIFSIPAERIVGQYFSPERTNEVDFRLFAQVIFPSLAPAVVRRSEGNNYPQVVDISFESPSLELRVTTDRIIDPAGQLLGFVKLIQDRTREIQLIRAKSEFIAVASHQLRTPLTSLHWALESLSQSVGDDQKEIASMALQSATKLSKTVNDLLDVSKIEEGKFGYHFENVNIVDFVEEIIKEVQDLAKVFNIKVNFQRPSESEIVLCIDQNKLRMAILNLLDNAIRYNVENGEVIVNLERVKDKPYLQISVKDSGVGIPPDAINKIFTKFFRSENVVKSHTEGSGLGLYIVRNIIRSHGGEIWAESELNRGSIFYFTLPTDSKLVPVKEMIYGEE